MNPDLKKRLDRAKDMLALFEADAQMYQSEEGKALVRQDVLQILIALEESLGEYRSDNTLGLRVLRDDDWADLWISGLFGVEAYVGCRMENQSFTSAKYKVRLYTIVGNSLVPRSELPQHQLNLQGFREMVQKGEARDLQVDFFDCYKPVFVEQKLLWSDVRTGGESAKTAPEIVDSIATNYGKQVERMLEAKAKNECCHFLFREHSDHKNSGTA